MSAPVINTPDPQLVAALGAASDFFTDWYRYFGRIIHQGVVPAAVKEAARQRVAATIECRFCMGKRMHNADGSPVLSDGAILAARSADQTSPDLDDRQRLGIAFADALLARHRQDEDGVDAMHDALRDAFGADGFVELGLALAQFIGASSLFKNLGLESPVIDAPGEGPTDAHELNPHGAVP